MVVYQEVKCQRPAMAGHMCIYSQFEGTPTMSGTGLVVLDKRHTYSDRVFSIRRTWQDHPQRAKHPMTFWSPAQCGKAGMFRIDLITATHYTISGDALGMQQVYLVHSGRRRKRRNRRKHPWSLMCQDDVTDLPT